MSEALQKCVVDRTFSHSAAHSITTTTIQYVSFQGTKLQYSERARFPSKS
jgi:hypothetical protein